MEAGMTTSTVMHKRLDAARSALDARVDAFVFAVEEWQRSTQLRERHACETIAWNRLHDALDALLGCFDPLIKVGGLNRTGRPGEFVQEIGAFRAEGRHVDLVRNDHGFNFTNQLPGGRLDLREVMNRVEQVDEIFSTLAHRLEKLIHDQKVDDRPELRAIIEDLGKHADRLRPPCRALAAGAGELGASDAGET
jgi:hypothetical protein